MNKKTMNNLNCVVARSLKNYNFRDYGDVSQEIWVDILKREISPELEIVDTLIAEIAYKIQILRARKENIIKNHGEVGYEIVKAITNVLTKFKTQKRIEDRGRLFNNKEVLMAPDELNRLIEKKQYEECGRRVTYYNREEE